MKPILMSGLLAVLLTSLGMAQAQGTQTKEQMQEQIYGSQLMTQQERDAHRQKMHAAKTQEERERIRLDHHKQMQERAKAKGITLPDEVPMGGKGMGPGGGGGGR